MSLKNFFLLAVCFFTVTQYRIEGSEYGPQTLVIPPDKSQIYLINFDDNTISIIDASDNTVKTTITVDSHVTLIVNTTANSDNDGATPTPSIPPLCILPPTNAVACVKKNQFLNKTEYTLIGTFDASPSPGVIFYRIFRNEGVVLEIPAHSPLSFNLCLKSKKNAGEFSVAAVGEENIKSERVPFTITGSCCKKSSF